MAMRLPMAVAVVVVAVSFLASGGAAQTSPYPECASKLVPCAPYMNGTNTPPDTCCGPLKDAVKNDLKCLCALYASPEIFKAFNISMTDALRLSTRCGISESTSSCKNAASPTNSPPGSPSGGKNASHRPISTGFAGSISLFLVVWSVLA